MTTVTPVAGNTPAPAPKKRQRATAESLRASTTIPRELALASLTADEKAVFEQFLTGDQEALVAVKNADVRGAFFNAQLHVRADILHVHAVIKQTVPDENEDPMALIAGMSGGAGAGAGPGTAPFSPPVSTLSTAADVQNAVLDWEAVYGPMRGDFMHDTFSAAVKCESKTAMMVLMDLNLVNDTCVREMHIREARKAYATPTAYDVVKEHYVDSMLKKLSLPLIESLTEHARGKDMLAKADPKRIYATQDFLFDERQVDTLDRFVSTGGDANMLSPEAHANRHWLSMIAYKADAEDIPTLDMLHNKHGLLFNVYDEHETTPFMMAVSKGNLSLVQFLLTDAIDVYAVNDITHKSALDLAEEGPVRRAKEQDMTTRNNAFELERHEEDQAAWQLEYDNAVANGEEPPKPLNPFQAEPVPPDYPLEIISLVQDAVAIGDPNLFKKAPPPNVYETNPDFESLALLSQAAGEDIDFSGF